MKSYSDLASDEAKDQSSAAMRCLKTAGADVLEKPQRVKATFSDSSVCDSVTVSAVCFFITVYLILYLFSSSSSLLCPLLSFFSGDDCVNWVNILLNIAFWALISDCHIMTVVK